MTDFPPLLVTMGDPAGIGPEVTLAAWAALRAEGPRFVAVADPRAYDVVGAPGAPTIEIDHPSRGAAAFETGLPVWRADLPSIGAVSPGRPTATAAHAIIAAISAAVRAVSAGAGAALVTNPIAKSVLYEAGFVFPGHTEFVAHLTDVDPAAGPVMMLIGGGLRVALATIHLPLAAVPGRLDAALLVRTGQTVFNALTRDFGLAAPRLAVAGLNPHAGEGGALGSEDLAIIAPAIETLRADGHRVTGPHPADTLFHPDARSTYDAVLAMYHDQGLIPVKTLDFHGGVNVTLGLPIVRTSPDHGTAFDIAGRGLARPDSLIAAIRLADDIARRRASAAAS